MTDEEIVVALTKHENEIKSLKHRVTDCEQQNDTISSLTISVNKLAVNMEHMIDEQKDQSTRLTALEKVPAERLRYFRETLIKCVLSSIAGSLLGALMTLILK